MTSPALLMVVASIVSVQGPMAQIDLGFSDGLIEGVEGQAYYELMVTGQRKRIDVGRATVAAVDESTATIRLAATRPLYPGQQVQFEIAQPKRSSTPGLSEPVAPELIAPQPVPVEPPQAPITPSPVVPAPMLPAEPVEQPSIDPPTMDQSTAPVVLDESSSVADVVDSETRMKPEAVPITKDSIAMSTIAMNTIDGGAHWVGLDPSQAEFFNQTPRFATEINPYRIDLEPVSDGPDSDGPGSDTSRSTLRGVTYIEAERYCDRRGARLPTEYEWEVAAALGRLDFVVGLLEWTASWYQPYPGNNNNEAEYGQRFRVLRGSPASATLSPYDRRFMAPDERNSQVGFRCVEETP